MAPTIASQVHSTGSNNSFSPKVWEMHIEPNWITIEQCKVGLRVSQTVFDHPGYKWVSTPGYDHFDGHNKDPFQWIFIKQRCASMVWIFDHELVEGKLSMCECQMFATGHISEFLNCRSLVSLFKDWSHERVPEVCLQCLTTSAHPWLARTPPRGSWAARF